jgi:hypothetical protein
MSIEFIPKDKRWKYARTELEKRFLLKEAPISIEDSTFKRITDKYLSRTNCRLRKEEDNEKVIYKLTKKIILEETNYGKQWISTIYLDKIEYEFFQLLDGIKIEKKRYKYECSSQEIIGIDKIQLGEELMWIAEVEFEDLEKYENYKLPIDYEEEITNNKLYTGYELALKHEANKKIN